MIVHELQIVARGTSCRNGSHHVNGELWWISTMNTTKINEFRELIDSVNGSWDFEWIFFSFFLRRLELVKRIYQLNAGNPVRKRRDEHFRISFYEHSQRKIENFSLICPFKVSTPNIEDAVKKKEENGGGGGGGRRRGGRRRAKRVERKKNLLLL